MICAHCDMDLGDELEHGLDAEARRLAKLVKDSESALGRYGLSDDVLVDQPSVANRISRLLRERAALKAEVERLSKFLADTSLCEGCEEKRGEHLKGVFSGAGSWRRRAKAAEADRVAIQEAAALAAVSICPGPCPCGRAIAKHIRAMKSLPIDAVHEGEK